MSATSAFSDTSASSTAHRVTAATYRRRRAAVLLVLVGALLALGAAIGGVGALAELEDPVAGHVVVAPGDTLWEVAVATAEEGVDPRAQLAAIQELNGLAGGEVEAWTVLLLPAH